MLTMALRFAISMKPPSQAQLRKRDFESVAREELPVLYRVARRLTRDTTLAEDLVGQALLDASRGWNSFDGQFPRSWLIRILQNRFFKESKRAVARPTSVPLDESLVGEEIWTELDWSVIGPRLFDELDKLPEEYRLAVQLCDVEQLSYEEAASAMEVPIGTVRSRVFRGRRLLRQKLAWLVEGS